MKSIAQRLLAWVLVALFGGALLVGAVSYLVTLEEMNEVFDANLRQVALSVASVQKASVLRDTAAPFQIRAPGERPDDNEIVTLTWTRDGKRTFVSDPAAQVPFVDQPGFARLHGGGVEWHVFTHVEADGVVQAAQRVAARREMATESATELILPFFALIGVVAAAIVYALRRGLEPLDRAAADVAARSALSLTPIAEGDLPREMHPLLRAINGLMQRLAVAFARERRFVADAAHELRTPVTALKLQLELVESATDAAARAEAMGELRSGIDRSERLIAQLLQLARVEPDAPLRHDAPLGLADCVRSVVAEWSSRAEARRIDLGARIEADRAIHGDAREVSVLLTNLVENALRYTPAGSVVDVVATTIGGRPALQVIDDGPGIAPSERERVFDRFYRGERTEAEPAGDTGSGLGLAIVRAIAERHGAMVTLHTVPSGRGLEVRVVFG